MADAKISALTAAGAAADANEFAINEAGTSKKVTLAQMEAQMMDTPTIKAPIIDAGSATAGSKMTIASGTLLTTPEAGAFEYDGQALHFTEAAGQRGVVPSEHIIRLNAAYTLTSTTAAQKLFDASANGALTLATGTYFFEMLVALSSMSATSGNAQIQLLGAGTATLASQLWEVVGADATTGVTAIAGQLSSSNQSAASAVTAGTTTGMHFSVRGTFEVTAAGTVIPSIALVTAAAAVVAIGSYFKCRRVGDTSFATVGDWS